MLRTTMLLLLLISACHVQVAVSMETVWTGWSDWSICSVSCDQGVKSRNRECAGIKDNRLVRIEQANCDGPKVEKVICKDVDCPKDSVSVREFQCSLHDTDIIQGEHHVWKPFYGGQGSCELNCISEADEMYKSFGAVLDGIKCYHDGDDNDICVDGRCQRVGCDGLVGSNKVYDWCKMCGGNNVNCTIIRDSFTVKSPSKENFDYQLIVKVPAGATHLEVVDKSDNFLALANSDDTYIINGHWMIDWPEQYEFAGTTIVYKRDDNNETITAVGPTTHDLYIMLIFRVPNPGIDFKFFLPISKYDDVVIPKKKPSHGRKAMFGPEKPHVKKKTDKLDKQENNVLKNYDDNDIYSKHSVHENQNIYHNKDSEKKRIGNAISNNKNTHNKDKNQQEFNNNDLDNEQSSFTEEQSLGYDYFGLSQDLLEQIQAGKPDNNYKNVKVTQDKNEQEEQLSNGQEVSQDHTDDDINNDEDSDVKGHGTQPNYVHVPDYMLTGDKYVNIFSPSGRNTPCPGCHHYYPQIDYYCDSEFVLHGKVQKVYNIDGDTRYEVYVINAYKDLFPLMKYEYIWSPGVCPCPKLQENQEYIIMGKLIPHMKTRESRLQIEDKGYVKRYSAKHTARLRHMEEICARQNRRT